MQVTKLWRQDLMIQRHIEPSAESTKRQNIFSRVRASKNIKSEERNIIKLNEKLEN